MAILAKADRELLEGTLNARNVRVQVVGHCARTQTGLVHTVEERIGNALAAYGDEEFVSASLMASPGNTELYALLVTAVAE